MEIREDRMYVVNNLFTNRDKQPGSIFLDWTLTLLEDEMLKAWEKYKLTADYKGDSPEVINARRRLPEAVKLQEFVNSQMYGVPRAGAKGIINYVFELKSGETVFSPRRVVNFLRYERKPIQQKLKLGQVMADVDYEGFIIIQELDPSDAVWSNTKEEVKVESKEEIKPEVKIEMIGCEVCGKEFEKESQLRGHMLSHSKS